MLLRFTDYAALVSHLSDCANVAEDSMSSEETKNIIFGVEDENGEKVLKLIAVNQSITYKKLVDSSIVSIELNEGEQFIPFQLNSKELSGYLGAYKGLRYTRVIEVSLTMMESGRVLCTVLEEENESQKQHISKRVFVAKPIKDNLKSYINLQAPTEGLFNVAVTEVLFMTRNLLPAMASNQTGMYAQFTFGSDYAVVLNPSYTALVQNKLEAENTLKEVRFTQRTANFIDKVVCSNPDSSLEIARTERRIYFKNDDSESFIIYDTKMYDYSNYINMIVKDHAFTINRVYFKDVLRRLDDKENIEITVDTSNNILQLSNTKFSQDVDILRTKAMDEYGVIRFKVMPDVLAKAIIGDDGTFDENLYVYYNPQQSGNAALVFTDKYNMWFSIIRIKTTQSGL